MMHTRIIADGCMAAAMTGGRASIQAIGRYYITYPVIMYPPRV